MQKLFFLFIAVLIFSCSGSNMSLPTETSYWKSLKDSFATMNLKNFVVDAELENNYKNFCPIQNRAIDSVIQYGTPYLYSWQENSPGKTSFTTFVDKGEHGNRIIYFIFDGKDSLCSATEVATKAGEGGVLHESRSAFITKDTLYKTSAATTQWDFSKPDPWSHRLTKRKGDSLFFHLIILKDGRVVEKQFAEKKELNLE